MIERIVGADVLIVGTGYVGLVSAVGLAKLGNRVVCYDINTARIEQLQKGEAPFYEPGVAELLTEGLANQRLVFSDSLTDAYRGQRYIFVGVQTPKDSNGKSDMSALKTAISSLASTVTKPAVVIVKSTVPVGIFNELEKLPTVAAKKNLITFVSCPEFLAEGTAVENFFHPMRTIVGSDDKAISEEVAGLFYGLGGTNIITDAKTAQMIKYSANSFLAARVAFINDISEICEKFKISVNDVADALVMDPRVGGTYLSPSMGFGGPCLSKDISALVESSEQVGAPALMLRGVIAHNEDHLSHVIDIILDSLGDGKVVTIFGLSFKPNTDDVRNSFSLRLIRAFLQQGITVRATDPHSIPAAQREISHVNLEFYDDPFEAAAGSELQLFMTPWEDYKTIDIQKLGQVVKRKNIYDSMQIVSQKTAEAEGFTYAGVGSTYGNAGAPPFEVSQNPTE